MDVTPRVWPLQVLTEARLGAERWVQALLSTQNLTPRQDASHPAPAVGESVCITPCTETLHCLGASTGQGLTTA